MSGPAIRRWLVRTAVQLATAALAVAIWQLLTRSGGATSYWLPPSTIMSTIYHQWFSGPAGHLWLTSDATGNLLPSLGRMLGGWAAASVVGVAAGIAIGRIRLLADLAEPLVHFGRAVPPPTVVPVFLFVFKIGTPMEVAAIIFGVIWPVLINSIDGARHVDPLHLDTARAFRVPAAQRLARIVLPGAAPKIFAGLRLALSLSLIMMIISEFVGSLDGIGREEIVAQSNFDVPLMWAVIVLLGLLGIVLNTLFGVLEHSVLRWQRHPGRAA
jgi:ABC-type nitrate/sulfonate/bicarbonate transport system permease component